MERRALVLTRGLNEPEHLARRCLIEARLGIDDAHRLENVHRTQPGDLRGQHRLTPRARDEALRGKVVDFVRLGGLEAADQRRQVEKVAVHRLDIALDAELPQPPQHVAAAARQQTMDAIAFVEQQLGEIGAVLSSDAGDECGFTHGWRRSCQSSRMSRSVWSIA